MAPSSSSSAWAILVVVHVHDVVRETTVAVFVHLPIRVFVLFIGIHIFRRCTIEFLGVFVLHRLIVGVVFRVLALFVFLFEFQVVELKLLRLG